MIKVIIFDFGGVLGPDADDWKNTFKQIPKLTGLTESTLQNLFNLHWAKLKTGEESMKTFWQFVAKESPNEINPKKLREIYNKSIYIKKAYLGACSSYRDNLIHEVKHHWCCKTNASYCEIKNEYEYHQGCFLTTPIK